MLDKEDRWGEGRLSKPYSAALSLIPSQVISDSHLHECDQNMFL